MNVNELCASVGQTLPPLFTCSPAAQEGVRVRTPMPVSGRWRGGCVCPGARQRLHRH